MEGKWLTSPASSCLLKSGGKWNCETSKMKHRYILQTSQNGVTAEMIFVGGAAFTPSQLMKRVYLPPDVIPDDGACDCRCWACSSEPLDVWTFDAPVFELPVSPTSTQPPPRWLPVFAGTHTICFPLFAPALVPAQAVTRTRISPTKPICSNLVFIIQSPPLVPKGKMRLLLPNPRSLKVTRLLPPSRVLPGGFCSAGSVRLSSFSR